VRAAVASLQWCPPPAKGENSTGCRIDCSAAAKRAGNVVVPERHCRRHLTGGSAVLASDRPPPIRLYVLHFPRRRLSSGSGRAVPSPPLDCCSKTPSRPSDRHLWPPNSYGFTIKTAADWLLNRVYHYDRSCQYLLFLFSPITGQRPRTT